MTVLVSLPYSPWSERARWALEHHRVPYRRARYTPLLGEPGMRLKLRRPFGKISVPVLFPDDGPPVADSTAIARWADARGEGAPLFPAEHEGHIAHWLARSDLGLAGGRARALARMAKDDEALAEMVPPALLRVLGKAAIATSGMGVRRTLKKYENTLVGDDGAALDPLAVLTSVLDELRAALAEAPPRGDGPACLLGTLSYADITAAQVLAFIDPPSFGLRVGPASARTFRDDELRERYADLVAWRDALYEAHRPRASA